MSKFAYPPPALLILLTFLTLRTAASSREALDISITLPPLPVIPDLLNFADQRLADVYSIIQNFKTVITLDPFNVTQSWVGADICSYTGFFCDNPPDNKSATTVASIDFNGFGLSAPTIEGFLDQFPDLAIFHANSNNFGGTIPPKISSLRYLYEFDISNNKFTGTFPVSVLAMEGLTFLDIRFNLFSGAVPPQIFIQNLEALFINDNSFSQSLPSTLGETHIEYLTLANNKFTGPLPAAILKSMSTLTEVIFSNNNLSGCLPNEMGYFSETVLIDVSGNQLTGPLPPSLKCLEKVELLDFANNLLFGLLPEGLCELENLGNLSLSGNYINNIGPACRASIDRGVLDVRNNCIPGLPNQRPFMECAKFFAQPRHCPRGHMWWFHAFTPCKSYHFHGTKAFSP